jgi:glycosyltransferase involved in cell wall biosynthesis
MLEAMAAGAVPVVSDVGDLRDLVHDGVNGRLVDQDAIDDYCGAIVRLLDEPERWTACSRAAVQTVAQTHSVEAVAGRWTRHLGELVTPHHGAETGDRDPVVAARIK